MEKKLQVKDLTISFRTTNGKVQAVRGINFDLNKGETLAIVGESGSGKSVTSKAILGILAGNSIVEGGEIIYDGQDLLKISEEDFHKIRGDKIAMIFQDPMSSLNPIIKIGRQLTEAMILKGKARQRESRLAFNTMLKNLKDAMTATIAGDDKEKAAIIAEKCANFDKFETKHLELESAYNIAHDAATEGAFELESLIFEVEKDAAKDLNYRVKQIAEMAKNSVHEYVVKDKAEAVAEAAKNAVLATQGMKAAKKDAAKLAESKAALIENLTAIKAIFDEAATFVAPNFFAMGYYMTFCTEPLPALSVAELNVFLRKYLDDNFMLDFIADARRGVEYSASESYREKEEALSFLEASKAVFQKAELDRKECNEALKSLAKEVGETIDKLEIIKDSLAYTFASGMKSEIDRYFKGIVKNEKEAARYAKEQAAYDRLVAKGKEPDGKVVPAAITDLELVKKNILSQIDRLINHYKNKLENRGARDYDAETVAIIDYLKAMASGVVNKVTKSIAKNKALKLMKEVGIPEPRKRYNQYPFEFSGGMRQRIVIAIALAANPDILICDEPTTALDVTIQSQILELINNLKHERQLSVIFITHDLGVVANMADRIGVMYAGKIVEYGTSEDIFYESAHPYTWALLSSMPDLDTNEKLDAIPGTPPNMIYPPVGDAFAARNKYAMQIDFERQPPMFKITDTHYAATWLLHPDAPKVEPPRAIVDRIARMKNRRGDKDAE